MKKTVFCQALLAVLLSFITLSAYAWNNSVEFGYAYSHDPNNVKYNNSGYFLSSDLYPINRTSWTFWSINGALGQWKSTAPHNQDLTTAALSVALRLYAFDISECYHTYLLGAVGPAYLSNRYFGTNKQGSNVAFQLNGGLGVELNQFDINLRWIHFSNAHLANPDHGFNFLYTLSVGYLF